MRILDRIAANYSDKETVHVVISTEEILGCSAGPKPTQNIQILYHCECKIKCQRVAVTDSAGDRGSWGHLAEYSPLQVEWVK